MPTKKKRGSQKKGGAKPNTRGAKKPEADAKMDTTVMLLCLFGCCLLMYVLVLLVLYFLRFTNLTIGGQKGGKERGRGEEGRQDREEGEEENNT